MTDLRVGRDPGAESNALPHQSTGQSTAQSADMSAVPLVAVDSDSLVPLIAAVAEVSASRTATAPETDTAPPPHRTAIPTLAGAAILIAIATVASRVVGFGRWLVFSHTVG